MSNDQLCVWFSSPVAVIVIVPAVVPVWNVNCDCPVEKVPVGELWVNEMGFRFEPFCGAMNEMAGSVLMPLTAEVNDNVRSTLDGTEAEALLAHCKVACTCCWLVKVWPLQGDDPHIKMRLRGAGGLPARVF